MVDISVDRIRTARQATHGCDSLADMPEDLHRFIDRLITKVEATPELGPLDWDGYPILYYRYTTESRNPMYPRHGDVYDRVVINLTLASKWVLRQHAWRVSLTQGQGNPLPWRHGDHNKRNRDRLAAYAGETPGVL